VRKNKGEIWRKVLLRLVKQRNIKMSEIIDWRIVDVYQFNEVEEKVLERLFSEYIYIEHQIDNIDDVMRKQLYKAFKYGYLMTNIFLQPER
jgi:hypothetical protein